VGASTIAVHLAWHFARHANRHTVLLDSDLHRGTCALMLNAQSGPGLRMALETPQRIDELFVERAAQPVGERLHVLAGEENLAEQPGYEPGAVARLVDTLRHRYNFVVVDVPFTGLPMHRDLLMLGHQRVLVMDPTLAGVRDTLRLLALPNGPLHAHRGLVVLNHANRTGGLTRKQVEEALKMPVDVTLPDLPKQLGNAATMGEPMPPRGGFHKGILALSAQVGGMRATDGPSGRRKADHSLWSRMVRFPR
jgi:pilus assembly protein CpaE